MVTARTRDDDTDRWPESDGKPMAENATNRIQMTDLLFALEQALAPRVRFCVGGNQMMYYDRTNQRRHISPDVYVALDVAPGLREKWQTWREGGLFPQVVFEITSQSTVKVDLGTKRTLYARLGVREYSSSIRPACRRRTSSASGARMIVCCRCRTAIRSSTVRCWGWSCAWSAHGCG